MTDFVHFVLPGIATVIAGIVIGVVIFTVFVA